MRFDPLFEPISADAPCGPDLQADGDDGYVDYYYEAMARLPERYIDTTTGETFDRKNLDLKAETKAIGALLTRSRDLRLFVLEAQFQVLSGQFSGFVDCVVACARFLEEQFDHVHPRMGDDPTDRRNTLELLDSRATVVMPLEEVALFRDRRLDQVSWRRYAVGAGKRDKRNARDVGDASGILSAMKSAENADAVAAAYAQLAALKSALTTIINTCRMADSSPFSPNLNGLVELVDEMVALFAEARPDLASPPVAADAEAEAAGEAGEGAVEGTPRRAAVAGAIASHAAARAALAVAEGYFGRIEPSSPAFFLVRQARLLIGRPLVEALQILLPELAATARIGFGSDANFAMAMDRMKTLSEGMPNSDDTETPVPNMVAETRDQATAILSAVETYFRTVEPSSPVPVLIFKAKSYLNRDFAAIISELFPPKK